MRTGRQPPAPNLLLELLLNARASAFALIIVLPVLSGCSSSEDSPTAGVSTAPPAVPETTVPSAAVSAPPPVTSTAGGDGGGPESDGASYGLLTALGGDRVLRYDKVDYLPAAGDRRTEEEVADSKATLRICFRNINPLIRTVRVSPAVIIGYYMPDGYVSEQPGSDYDDHGRSFDNGSIDLPVRLTLSGGIVTRIDEAGLLAG